jgi:Ras-related protein Rab-1A
MDEYDYLMKAIVVGDSGVGKSNVLSRFVDDRFQEHYISTIGVDFHIKTIREESKIVKMQLWDTAGQEKFRTIVSSYYRGAHCVVLSFDLTYRPSFDHLGFWLNEVDRYVQKDVLVVLVGNKSDANTCREVSFEEAHSFASSRGMKYYETSAKTGANIEKAFRGMVSEFLNSKNTKIESVPKDAIVLHLASRDPVETSSLSRFCSC